LIAASIAGLLLAGVPVTNAWEPIPLSPDQVRERAGQLPPDLLHEVAAMQYVLRPAEITDLLSDADASRCRAWIEAWWFARDPIPTNTENEARVEHEQRVLAAQAHFGRGAWPGWDDRGAAVIRYGAPAVRDEEGADVQPPGIFIPAEETWYYPQFNVYARFSDTGKYGYVQYMESPQSPIGDRPRNDRRVMASVHLPDLPMDLMDVDVLRPAPWGPAADGRSRLRQLHDRVNGYYDLVDKMPAIYPFDYADITFRLRQRAEFPQR
jgi:GWxTD domain-containing protein